MRQDLETAYNAAPPKAKKPLTDVKMPLPEEIEQHLAPDEKVVIALKSWHLGSGLYYSAVSVVTDRAIHIVSAYGFGSKRRVLSELIPAHTITGLSSTKVIPYGWGVEITRAGNTDKLVQCEPNHMENWLSAARELMSKNIPSAGGNTTIVQELDPLDQLKKLKELLDAGILTQDEFDAKKVDLLGKI